MKVVDPIINLNLINGMTKMVEDTKAYWTEKGPRFEYEEVDISLVKPVLSI